MNILLLAWTQTGAVASEGKRMNNDQVQGQLDQFNAKVKQQWGELTDDEVKKAEGNKDQLIARIQEKYGDTKEEISKKFNEMKEGADA